MANYNWDVLRVFDTAANIATTLRNKQFGWETTNDRLAVKDASGVMHYIAEEANPTDITLTDNVANAFRVREGANEYMNINTTNASERLTLGSAAINPVLSFLGRSAFNSGATDLVASFTSSDDLGYITIADDDTTGHVLVKDSIMAFGLNAGLHVNNLQMRSNGATRLGDTPSLASGFYVDLATLAGVYQYGIGSECVFSSTATTEGIGIYSKVATAAAVFTMADAYGVQIGTPSIGAGSGIDRVYGLRVENQAGANIANFAIHTGSGLVRFGENVRIEDSLYLAEKAAATTDFAGYGQLWVLTAAPNQFWFTDDAGNKGPGFGNNTIYSGAATLTVELTGVSNKLIFAGASNHAVIQSETLTIILKPQSTTALTATAEGAGSSGTDTGVIIGDGSLELAVVGGLGEVHSDNEIHISTETEDILLKPVGKTVARATATTAGPSSLGQGLIIGSGEAGIDYHLTFKGETHQGHLTYDEDNNHILSSCWIHSPRALASIYIDGGAAAQTIPTGSTPTKSTAFATDGASQNCTADAANDKITITRTGYYLALWKVSLSSGSDNVSVFFSLFLDGAAQAAGQAQEFIATGGIVHDMGGHCIIDAAVVNKDVDLRVRHNAGGDVDLTVVYATLSLTYIGET